MTDAPDAPSGAGSPSPGPPEPAPKDRWRQRGIRGLTAARDRSVQGWHWVQDRWERMLASLQDEEPVRVAPAPPPPGPLVEQRDAPALITVPARGYLYHFGIRATFLWSTTTSVRADVLSWYAQYYLPNAIQKLTRLAADAARNLDPHDAATLEVRLQRILARETPWTWTRGNLVVTCRPDASVRLDDRIKPALQPHIDRQIRLTYEIEEHLREARYAAQLSGTWARILSAHADGDQELTDARQHLLALQKAAAEWIEELLARRTTTPPSAEPPPSPTVPPQQPREPS